MAENQAKIILSAEDRTAAAIASVKANLSSMQPQITAATGALLGFTTAMGAAAAAWAAVTNSAKAIDAFNDLSDATGSSVENISALDRVARQTGTNLDTVATSLVKFNGALKESDSPNSGAAQALKAIGLNAKELKSIDPSEALRQTAVALASFADDGNKARLVQELFGKSLKEVAPFLKDLSEQGALYGKVTSEQAAEAEKFNKELYRLKANSEDAARALSMQLVVAINETIKAFRDGEIAGKSFFSVGWDRYWSNIRSFYGAADGPKEYAKRLEEINETLAKGNIHASKRAALLREQAALEKKISAAPDFSPDNESAAEKSRLARRPSVDFSLDKEKAAKVDAMAKLQQSAIQGLSEQLMTASGNASEFDKVMERLTNGTWKSFDAETRAVTLSLAGEIDQAREAMRVNRAWQEQHIQNADEISAAYVAESKAREQGRLAIDEYVKAIDDQNDAYKLEISLLGKSDSARKIALENYRIELQLKKEIEKIDRNLAFDETQREELRAKARAAAAAAKAGAKGAIDAQDDRLKDPVAGMKDGLLEYQRTVENVAENTRALMVDAFKGMENALVDFAKTGKLDFKGLADSIISDIIRIRVQKDITGPIANAIGGSSGGFFGSLKSLLGFADGGMPPVGIPSIVGERGPELFVPSVPGTIIPNHELGGVSITQNINIDSRSDQASILSAMTMAKNAALTELQNSRRRGGVYA